MAVKTKSIYEAVEPDDGVRVLVTRYYPRGVKKDRFDRWVRALSPSRELVSRYKSRRIGWDRFKRSFLEEMGSSPESIEALREVYGLGKAGDVTLLCYEKTGLPCHRLLVREILTTPRLFSSYVRPSRLPAAGGAAGAARTRIRFYSRRKVGRKAPK